MLKKDFVQLTLDWSTKLVSLFKCNINLHGLFNTPIIVAEEQWWYYLTYSRVVNLVMSFTQ